MHKHKWIFIGVVTPMLVMVSAAVSVAGTLSDPLTKREIKVTARRFEFSPKTITVSKGEKVSLVITSEDVDHGFAIKELGIDQEIKAKQTKVIEFTPDKEGRFQFTCSVFCGDGHDEMIGELVVTGTPTPVEAASQMKVTFDPASPGVVIVESAGERVRIDTSRKTVDRLAESQTVATAEKSIQVATKERE